MGAAPSSTEIHKNKEISLKVSVATWKKESNGLFDYSTKSHTDKQTSKVILKSSSMLYSDAH